MRSAQLILPILFQHHTSKLGRYFWSFRRVQDSAPTKPHSKRSSSLVSSLYTFPFKTSHVTATICARNSTEMLQSPKSKQSLTSYEISSTVTTTGLVWLTQSHRRHYIEQIKRPAWDTKLSVTNALRRVMFHGDCSDVCQLDATRAVGPTAW